MRRYSLTGSICLDRLAGFRPVNRSDRTFLSAGA
jgi:hypothetical protein